MEKVLKTRMQSLLGWMMLLVVLASHQQLALAEQSDRDQPIELEADTVTVNDAKKISVYSGNVILTQGTLQIKADKMIVREDLEGFQHSTSTGNPTTFKQKSTGKDEWMQGSAQRIEYNARLDKVQLYTGAWVKRGEDIVHGDYISYDANAEYAEVIGGTKANPAGTPNSRVKAVIQPKNRSASATSDTLPAQDAMKANRGLQLNPSSETRQ